MAIRTTSNHPTMVPSTPGSRPLPTGVGAALGGCYDRSVDEFDNPGQDGSADPAGADPTKPHAFLAADTFVPLGPFSGGGAAIRGLLTPKAVVTARADRCALCGRPGEDPIHGMAQA
jgi:hypothetical protein